MEHLKHPSGRERLLPLLTSMTKPVCQPLRRPLETVLGLLTNPLRDAFTNEDGKVVIDAERRRVTR